MTKTFDYFPINGGSPVCPILTLSSEYLSEWERQGVRGEGTIQYTYMLTLQVANTFRNWKGKGQGVRALYRYAYVMSSEYLSEWERPGARDEGTMHILCLRYK